MLVFLFMPALDLSDPHWAVTAAPRHGDSEVAEVGRPLGVNGLGHVSASKLAVRPCFAQRA